MTTMTLHEALQHEPNLQNCQGIPQYITVLADLLEYNTFDTINIKRELPNWIKKNIRRATATQNAAQNQSLFNNSNPLRHVIPNTQMPQQKKKQKNKNPKKKKFKEKRDDSMYLSKNRKRKLRKIYEKEEEYQLMCEERDSKYFQSDKLQPEFNTPKKQKNNKILKKSNSNVDNGNLGKMNLARTQSNISNKFQKTISFHIDDISEAKNKMVKEESKSSKSKSSRSKERKKTQVKVKPCEFIPIRESQLNNSMLLLTPMKNKDDFAVPDHTKGLDVEEPSLKKKVQSYNVSNIKGTPDLDCDEDNFVNHGFTDPILSNKYKTNMSNVIQERVSENFQSSHVSDSASEGQEFNPMMNTLFVPKVDTRAEGSRKRVISFKKNNSEQPPANERKPPSINEIDEYLDISDADMDDESIEKFIKKTNESQKLRKDSIDDLLDDSDQNDLGFHKFDDPNEEIKEDPRLRLKQSRRSDEMDYNEELINSALRVNQKGNSSISNKIPPFT